jgi:cytochrome c biogenesis protein CcmG, thiol:disulfide interchange protein DsbE
MRHPARWAALGVGIVVTVLAVVLATQVGTDPQAEILHSQLVGKRAPTFSVHTFDGQTLSSQSLAGKPVLVNFWNSWCIPCQQELPSLLQFEQRHAGDTSFVLLGVVRDDTTDAARQYAAAEGMTWPLAADPGSSLALGFGTRGQPETYAISPNGRIAGAQIGPTSVRSLETLLAAARPRA